MNRFWTWLWIFWICLNPPSTHSVDGRCPRAIGGRLCLLLLHRRTDEGGGGRLPPLRVLRCPDTAGGVIDAFQTAAISSPPDEPGATPEPIENKRITASSSGSEEAIGYAVSSLNLTLSSCSGREEEGSMAPIQIPVTDDHPPRDNRSSESTDVEHSLPPVKTTATPQPYDDTYRLNLSSFGVGDLDEDVFAGIEASPAVAALRDLDLSGNFLRRLNLDNFRPLVFLETLNLSNNLLEYLAHNKSHEHPTTGGLLLPKIRTVDISGNRLVELPRLAMLGLDRLQVLNVSGNWLLSLGREELAGSSADSLTHLDLSANRIKVLGPGTFSCMTMIKYLDLSRNFLTSVKNYTFVNLHGLTVVNLSRNSIEDMEVDAFFTWRGGKCGGEKEKEQENVTFASSVNHSDAGVTGEGCSINRWPALESFDMSHNSLTAIRDNTFRTALCGVRELYLGYNRIAHLPRYVIEQLRCLTVIDLQHNEIFWLDVGIFTNPSLRSVDLSFNRLRKVISMAFLYLPSVLSIDLSHNEIGYIYKYAFYRLCKDDRRSIRISLRGNRLQTDGLWKMLSVFQHQENSACAMTVDMRDNHVTRFLGDAVKQVRREITLAERKRFERWQTVSVDLEGNEIRCDCATAEEINTLEFVDRSFQESEDLDSSIRNNLRRWSLLNCSEEDGGHRGLKVRDFLEMNACPDLTRYLCPVSCDCRTDARGTKLVNCSGRGLADLPSFPIENRTDLDLSHNELTELRPSDDMRLQFLRSVDLSHNRLRSISREAVLRMTNIEELFLDNNELKSLPTELADLSQLTNLTLRNNPLSCTCRDVWVPEVAVRMREVISGFEDVLCSGGMELSRREALCVGDRSFEPFSGETKIIRSNSRALIVLVGILPIVGVAIVTTVYRVRNRNRTLPVAARRRKGMRSSRLDCSGGPMDVFLSHCPADEDWIKGSLLDIIWNQFPRCVVRFGSNLDRPEALTRQVDESKVTLLVTSAEFFRTSWRSESYRATILDKMENSPYGRMLVIARGRAGGEEMEASEFKGHLSKVTWLMADDDCFAQNLIQCLSLTLGNTADNYERVFVDSDDEDQKLEKY